MPNSFQLLERIHQRASTAPDATAVIDACETPTRTHGYASLYRSICRFATELEQVGGGGEGGGCDLEDARVGIVVNKGYPIVVALLATYAAGGIALPLLPTLPLAEHEYMVQTAGVSLILCDSSNESRANDLVAKLPEGSCTIVRLPDFTAVEEEQGGGCDLPDVKTFPTLGPSRKAMMLFTSGTTGRPKGVITRHSALTSQVSSLTTVWRWTSSDLLLHVLPLNHLHGITVALLTTLWAGAAVELWSKLDGEKVWKRWIEGQDGGAMKPITMMFGVPTVYTRLTSAHQSLPPTLQSTASAASSTLRLQVSGSAPLPEGLKKKWDTEVGGGQVLLERYGMTETGIILSTGWEAERRIAGHVGYPLPGMEVRLWNNDENTLVEGSEQTGEIQVRGASIFNEYWNLPEATAKEFVDGDWFKTGDVGARSGEHEGMYKILGRQSVDIIKSGGEKISAIDIERALLELDYISDAAVVGIEDEDWGQVVGAIVVTPAEDLQLEMVRKDLREKLAAFKLPRKLKVYKEIPRNAMGKIQKKTLVVEAFGSQA